MLANIWQDEKGERGELGALIVMAESDLDHDEKESMSADWRSEFEQDRPWKIIHIDLDAFYASVEQPDSPILRQTYRCRRVTGTGCRCSRSVRDAVGYTAPTMSQPHLREAAV